MRAADEKLIINELGPNFSRPRSNSSNTGAQATMVRCKLATIRNSMWEWIIVIAMMYFRLEVLFVLISVQCL